MNHAHSFRRLAALVLGLGVLSLAGCGSKHIWQAAQFGQMNDVQRMLNEKPELLNKPDPNTSVGWTPLISAIHGRHDRIVKYLLDEGADPRIKTGSNWDALQEARKQGKQSILKMVNDAIDKANKADAKG